MWQKNLWEWLPIRGITLTWGESIPNPSVNWMEDYYIIMVNTEGLAQCALIADELTARIVHSSLLLRIDKSSLGVSHIGVATPWDDWPYTKSNANTFVRARAYRVFLTSCVGNLGIDLGDIPPHSDGNPYTNSPPSSIVTIQTHTREYFGYKIRGVVPVTNCQFTCTLGAQLTKHPNSYLNLRHRRHPSVVWHFVRILHSYAFELLTRMTRPNRPTAI